MPAQGERPSAQPVTPQDIIFSCCVCLDTLAEVYDDRDRHIGLHSEPNQRTGRITKLYLTGCAHVVCAKHFEGGGVPFYPLDQLPKAACPYCKDTKGDDTLQTLFGINGTGQNDHDPNIPQTYFDAPPGKLSEEGSEAEALRFQYVSLLRYASMTYLKRRQAEYDLADEKAQRDEADRKQWAERTRKMQLLGKVLTATQAQLKRARDWLYDLNQDVSSIDDALSYQNINIDGSQSYQNVDTFDEDSTFSGESINARMEQDRTAASTQRFEGQLRLARGSAADLETMTRHHRRVAPSPALQQPNSQYAPGSNMQSMNRPLAQGPEHHPTLKRKRTDTTDDDQAQHVAAGPPSQRMRSRDAMPPPPFPAQRFTTQLPHNREASVPISGGPYSTFRGLQSGYNNPLSLERTASESPATATGHISPLEFRTRDDGELDNIFHQPTPQRPIYRPNSVSPVRERLTLTPRHQAPSRGTSTGLLSHARSSSSATTTTPNRHRQQLGQSPYFGNRQLPMRSPGRGMDPRIVNSLSFLEDPVIGSGGGRRRARR